MAELVRFHPELPAAFRRIAPETSLWLEDWPVAPAIRRPVVLTRHDVYAPDARLVATVAGREIEVPRSRLLFFWGIAEGDPSTRVLAFLDPDEGTIGGLAVSPDGMQEIVPSPTGGRSLVAPWDSRNPGRDGEPAWTCAGAVSPDERAETPAIDAPQPLAISSLHTLVVAIDTDNELLSLKFGDNLTNATDYLAQLFAALNLIYERDLFVRLLQGYTVLRVSSTTDPYVQGGGGNASSAQLGEFRNYWGTNYGGVKRGLAAMLSGKQSSANSSSGIASLRVLCNSAFGYSFTQVFKFGGSTGATDAFVVGHELGHNFGSHHTHCFPSAAAPVDQCYNAEAGCYSGPTSCPSPFTIDPVNGGSVSGVTGTLMSYCHLLSGCSASKIFHPESVNVIAPLVQNSVGFCVFPFEATAPTVAGISPNTGPTAGGSGVTITGSNFQSGATVSFADRSSATFATGVTVMGSSQITATLPARPAGLTDVVVSNPNHSTGTLPDGFTFVSGPVIDSISPNNGSTSGGTAITITGANFQGPATVSLGGAAASSVNVVNSTTITAVTAAHATGTVDLVVTIPGPQSDTLSDAFFYIPPLPAMNLHTVDPCRLVDTRTTHGPALAAQSTRIFDLTGTCSLPGTAKAVAVILSATGPSSPGFLTLFPGNGVNPGTSSLNFIAGATRANNAIVLLATDASLTLAVRNGSAGTVHFVLDVTGYFE
jgi:hypothetical protein